MKARKVSVSSVVRQALNRRKQCLRDELRSMRERATRFNENRSAIEAVTLAILTLLRGLKGKAETDVWISSHWQDQVQIGFTIQRVASFKDPALMAAFELAGTLCPDNHKTNDYAACLNRDFHFESPTMVLKFAVYADDGSASCKRVEVGRKMVEREEIEYKIVCD